MVLTVGKLKEVIANIDDDVVLADLTYGNEKFRTFGSVKRLLLIESKTTGINYLAINGLGSHFTGKGDQRLKQPDQIENYHQKAKVLRENGWTDLWHPDNWVRKIWYDDPTINIDMAGMSTDTAYSTYAKKENLPVVYKTEWVKST